MDRSAYDSFFDLEERHFWRIAKRKLVLDWIEQYCLSGNPRPGDVRILDIGGACSLIPKEMQQWGHVQVIEGDSETVAFARERLGVDIVQGWFPDDVPVEGQFDVVTMLDVLEHVEDDVRFLRAARTLMPPEGRLLVTVPALQWLWSDHDVALHHHRRYTKGGLVAVLKKAGFEVGRISYYTSLLLPLLAVQRMAGKTKSKLRGQTSQRPAYNVKVPAPPLNATMAAFMSLERWMLGWTRFCAGSSLIAVALPSVQVE